MTLQELRKKFLEYYSKQQHAVIPSASLIPENDPTTLFTGSGMQAILPYLLGQPHALGTRLTDSQKCFRTQDIEEVGDNRHTTFFEMLGNWSLGDYFKNEQIPWIFNFLTQELGLNPERIYVTVFSGNETIGVPQDSEAIAVWKQVFATVGINAKDLCDAQTLGMRDGRIFSYGEKKNWWSRAGAPENMPIGEPGGPDSEMFWDFGAQRKIHEQSVFADLPCHVNCDCGRFLEIGNSVFMEYIKTEKGFEPLPKKNVDFGGGLERMLAAQQDTPDIFLIDVFSPAMEKLAAISKTTYQERAEVTKAYRVILDHLRAATHLIADGAYPSNKDQGYFVRRLIRRSVRFSAALGIEQTFCSSIAETFIEKYGQEYPRVVDQREKILGEFTKEEAKFRKTLVAGLKMFEKWVKGMKHGDTLSAEQTFDLYQSYGFPLELAQELAKERGLTIDTAGFEQEKKKHQELSRAGSMQKFSGGLADHSEKTVRGHKATHLLHQALRKVLGE